MSVPYPAPQLRRSIDYWYPYGMRCAAEEPDGSGIVIVPPPEVQLTCCRTNAVLTAASEQSRASTSLTQVARAGFWISEVA